MADETIKIFISSRMNGELNKERKLAVKTIQQIARRFEIPIKPIVFEHEACPPSTTARCGSIEWVKESDVLIAVYYKSITPIVIDEFKTANERNLPIFIFVKQVEKDKLTVIEKEEYSELIAFINNEVRPPAKELANSSYVYKNFVGNDFRRAIVKAILNYYPRRFDFKRIHERYIVESSEPDKLNRMENVFVKPKCYAKIEKNISDRKLVIILGAAHTGKTSLALSLGNALKKRKDVRRFILYPNDGSPSDIYYLRDSAILFDDPFGGARFNAMKNSIGDNFEWVLDLSLDNFVILTSRKEVFDDALSNTKLGESNDLKEYIVELTPQDYPRFERQLMLENHLRYYNATSPELEIVAQHLDEIIDGLNFPHSYQIFVCHGLKKAVREKTRIADIIKEANEIENVVGRWFVSFRKKDKDIFYFLLTLSLLYDSFPTTFSRVHKIIVDRIRKTRKLNLFTPSHHDLKKFVRETSPYVSCRFTIDFDHPSYRQGIISKVKDEYIADLLAVVPVFKMLGRRENYRGLAISCLSEIGFIIPNKVIPILKQMLETDWMRDQDASNALCELGKAMPNKVLPVLNVLAKSENWNVSGDAQRALCNIGVTLPDKVIPIFLQWVDDKNNSALRFQGISCLEKIMPVRFDAILQYFRKWAEDDDCNVRKAVALSLRNVVRDKPDQILSILESLSTDKEWLVRSAAEVSFGKYHQKLP